MKIARFSQVQCHLLVSKATYSSARGADRGGQGGPGPLQYLEQQKEVRFQQMHNQGLRQFNRWSPGTPAPCSAHLTVSLYLLVVPEATHETETRELLGGTEENSVSPMRGH